MSDLTREQIEAIAAGLADDPAEVRFEGSDTVRALCALALEGLAIRESAKAHAENAMRMFHRVNANALVVQSMPFGAIIDNETREQFTPPIPDSDVAYGLVASAKCAAAILELNARGATIGSLYKDKDTDKLKYILRALDEVK